MAAIPGLDILLEVIILYSVYTWLASSVLGSKVQQIIIMGTLDVYTAYLLVVLYSTLNEAFAV